MDINQYLGRQYDAPPCWALVADVYQAELQQPVDAFQTVNNSIRAVAAAFRLAIHKNPDGFRQLAAPAEMCVVLLGRTVKTGLHHCGVFVGGRLLHAQENGVYYEEMSVIRDGYALVEYWAMP
jgi:hypothetical protein